MRQEFWGVKQADVIIFDLDTLTSFHLMGVAAAYEKPIVCVSETLKPLPTYFTGSVVGVFKTSDIEMILRSVLKKPRRKRPKTTPSNGELPEQQRSVTETTTGTKEKLQDMLQKSLEKYVTPSGNQSASG